MARAFEIAAASDTVRLDSRGRGDAAFTVTNVSGRTLRGRVKAVSTDPSSAGWISLSGDAERDFPAGGAQVFTANIAVPDAARPGPYAFRLDVVSVDNPDEETAQGPPVKLTVAPPAPPPPKSFVMWIVLATLLVLVLAAAAIWLVRRKPAPATFAGTWSTNFASLELRQGSDKVTGEYRLYGSPDPVHVEGVVAGPVLSGLLGDPGANNKFKVTLDPAARTFNGTWGADQPWCGVSTALSSLPEGCSFTGEWTFMFEQKPLAAALTQVAGKVAGTIDMGAPDHRKVAVNGDVKGWVLEGELKDLLGPAVPPMPMRWTAVGRKYQQFHGVQYELTLSSSQPELGVNFRDTCGFRQGATAPAPCRDPAGIVLGDFTLDAPALPSQPAERDNGPVRTVKVDGDFRATVAATAATAAEGQMVGFGIRRADDAAVWVRIGKSFIDLSERRSQVVLDQHTNQFGDQAPVDILIAELYAGDTVNFMIERHGDRFTFSFSRDGTSWTPLLGRDLDFTVVRSRTNSDDSTTRAFAAGPIELFVTAAGHAGPGGEVKAAFSNLAVIKP
ncbi:MAG: hypothetical protein ABI818_04370 [Acidobacteriota bacterium]